METAAQHFENLFVSVIGSVNYIELDKTHFLNLQKKHGFHLAVLFCIPEARRVAVTEEEREAVKDFKFSYSNLTSRDWFDFVCGFEGKKPVRTLNEFYLAGTRSYKALNKYKLTYPLEASNISE